MRETFGPSSILAIKAGRWVKIPEPPDHKEDHAVSYCKPEVHIKRTPDLPSEHGACVEHRIQLWINSRFSAFSVCA
jgi:hypothetical protein